VIVRLQMIVTPKKLHPIVGKKPWKVWKGVGSFLLFEFGKRHEDSKGKVHGAYTLWIYMAAWRIHQGGDELAHSESSDTKIKRAAVALIGQKLEAILLDTVVVPGRVHYAARFYFEGNRRLDVFMYERAKRDTIFMLYTPRTLIDYDSDGAIRSKKLTYRRPFAPHQ
jgi:hypothetical protein